MVVCKEYDPMREMDDEERERYVHELLFKEETPSGSNENLPLNPDFLELDFA